MKIAELWIEIDTKLDRFNKGMSDAERSMVRVGQKFTAIGKNLTMMVTLPILAVGAAAVKMGADFEQSMMNAASVSGATGEELKRMEAIARDMGETTVFSAKQAADAMYFMASAGWKVDDMGKAIKPTLDLAAATQSDLAFATDTVVASLNQFQLGSEGAERLTNVFAAAIGNSQATMEKLSISMRYVGPLFHSMGKEVEEAAATLMVLYNAGYDASMAGTALRMGMVKLMDGTKKTTDALARLNLTLKDVDPTTMHFADIIEILGQRGAKTKDVIDIFGVRAGPAFAALISQGGAAIRDFEKGITGTNAAAKMAEMQINTLKGSFKLLTSALTEAAIQIFKLLGPGIKDLVDNKLKPAVLWFNSLSESTKKTILVVGGLAAAMGPLLMGLGAVLTHLPKIKLAMAALVSPIGLAILGFAGLVKKLSDISTSIKNANKDWTALEKSLGRTPIWLEFIRQAQIAGLNLDWFMAKLQKNKNDVLKTLDELAKGEIKHSGDLRALYLEMVKNKEEMLQKDKELAEGLHKIEQRAIADIEAHKAALKAKGITYYALREDVEGYLKVMEEKIRIEETDADVIEERIAKLKETTTAEGLLYEAYNEVNKALKESKNLKREEIEQLETTKKALEGKIEALTKAEEVQKTYIKGLEFILTDEAKLAQQYAEGSISLLEYTSKMRELREERARMKDDLADLELAEGEVNLVLEEQENVLFDVCESLGLLPPAYEEVDDASKKTGEGIKITWEDVAKDMVGYWSNAMAQMVKEGINFSDVLNIGWQTMAVGAGSAVSKVISEVGSLGKLAGPLGALAGSIAGTAISALGSILGLKSEAQKAAEAAAKAAKDLDFWINNIMTATSKYGDISEATAKKIQEADKSMEGFAAVSKYFGDIIKDVGVTQENVNILWERAIGIIENWEQGHLSAGDAAKAASESFELLLEGAKDLGEEGSEAMIAFILKVRESGLEVKSVTDYVVSQLDRIPEALETLITAQEKTGQSIEGLELRTLEAFKAMETSGMDWTDIVHKMSPALNALRDRMEATGYTGSEAIQKLLKIAEVTEANKELFDAIEADRIIMEALGNTGFMTGEILNSFAKDAIGNYEELKKKFGNSDDALRAMGPTLQKLYDYSRTYGIELDDNTRKIIDQAMAINVVKGAQAKSVDAQKQMFKDLAKDIETSMDKAATKIANALSGGFDRAFDQAKRDADNAATDINNMLGRITPTINIDFDADVRRFSDSISDYFDRNPIGVGTEFSGGGIGGFQHEGIAWKPQPAWVAEKGPEVIADIQKLQAGTSKFSGMFATPSIGASQPVQIHNTFKITTFDGESMVKIVENEVIPILSSAIQDNQSGFTKSLSDEVKKY